MYIDSDNSNQLISIQFSRQAPMAAPLGIFRMQDLHMLMRMRNTLQNTRQQLHLRIISRLPIINAAELTKSSWAKPIKSPDLVPDVYKGFFDVLLSDGRNFPYVILVPALERFIHKTTEKLLCDTGDEIYVLTSMGNICEVLHYPLEHIRYVEHRTMLLDSYIKINGVTDRGISATSTIKFNTITDYLFLPILERMRLARSDFNGEVQDSEVEKFDYLVKLNYKFMNYAKHSLIGGEKVVHAVYQPEIRESVWAVLGKTFYRTIFPTLMSILTDQELIMIQENADRGGEGKYGGTWVYIPLSQIESLSLDKNDKHLLVFSIQLPEGERLKYLFADSLRLEVDQLLAHFRELTTSV